MRQPKEEESVQDDDKQVEVEVSESAAPWNEPDEETREAAEPLREHLEEALAAIDTPEKAERLAAKLHADVEARITEEEAKKAPHLEEASDEVKAETASRRVEHAVREAPDTPEDAAAAAIEAIAREAAVLEGPAYEALVDAVQQVTDPALKGEPEKLERPRRYLRDAIMQRMSFFQKYDTGLFIIINSGPRSPISNAFFNYLSVIFNGGWAWIIGTALFLPFRRAQTISMLKSISPPIWVAAVVVEVPVKKYFRRRRPFIDVVRAITVGKKPGNWSFPSGHAAAAFAGAWMMDHCLPRWRALWFIIASLVGFSRIYLGAHYPGDVLSGSVIGVLLAEGTRRSVERFKEQA
jgi:membrane-associated phospholipid phosphatase